MFKKYTRFISLLLVMTLAVSICTPISASAANNSDALSQGYYLLKCDFCDKYVDTAGTENNARVQIWERTTAQSNQVFYFYQVDNTYWSIINTSSNKAVSVKDSSPDDCASIVLYDYSGTPNQLWEPVKHSNGSYSFCNKNSRLYMDVRSVNSSNGAELIQCYFNGGGNQKFWLQKADQNQNSNSGYVNPNYNDDEIEIIYDDDDEDEEIWDYVIVNYTNYDLDDLTYDTLPEENKKYLAEISYLDEDDVYDRIAAKSHIPAPEYKKFYEVATKGKSNGVNPVIRKIYVTFKITYSSNKIYIRQAKKYVKYVKWTKANAKKASQEMQDWTEEPIFLY